MQDENSSTVRGNHQMWSPPTPNQWWISRWKKLGHCL